MIARPPGATEKENPNDFLQGRPAMTMQNGNVAGEIDVNFVIVG
jgi:hypothetical protein